MLRRGRGSKADVLLVRSDAAPLVVKDFAGRSPLVARTLGRWLCAREARAYQRLAGVAAVPRFLGAVDALAFAVEYRPGTMLGRALRGRLPASFLDELEASVAALHARGVVHLDLRHRSNVFADAEGHPVIVDFASAIRLDPRRRTGRWLVRRLGWFDRRALAKWRARLAPAQEPDPVPESEAPGAAGTSSAGSRGASRPM